ncbi:MAG: tetratricopeptide repeat protein [Bacteroidota bacterium]
MTPETFSHYLKNPSLLDDQAVDELWLLVKEYPYFQVARMLLARNLRNTGHEAYPLALRLAAAYAGDRSQLKRLIEGNPQNTVALSGNGFVAENGIQPGDDILVKEDNEEVVAMGIQEFQGGESKISHPLAEESVVFDKFIDSNQAEVEAGKEQNAGIQATKTIPDPEPEVSRILHNPLIDSIFLRLSEVKYTEEDSIPSGLAVEISEEKTPVPDGLTSHNELVERFIREEPRISAPRREFYHPEDKARLSASLPEDMVTETLAHIYEQQGHYNMAIKIYEKLMLVIPEKSSYFAVLIQEIEKKRK